MSSRIVKMRFFLDKKGIASQIFVDGQSGQGRGEDVDVKDHAASKCMFRGRAASSWGSRV